MSEAIDLLSVEQPKSSAKTTTSTEPKKEGTSLFDSMLANSKKELAKNEVNDKSTEETKPQTSENVSTETEEATENTKENKTKEPTKENINTDAKNENSSDEKADSKVETKPQENSLKTGGSLLDRLILESNKNMKTISKDEFDKVTKENIPKGDTNTTPEVPKTEVTEELDEVVKKDKSTNPLLEENSETENTKGNKTSLETKETNLDTNNKPAVSQGSEKTISGEVNIDAENGKLQNANTEANKLEIKSENIKKTITDTLTQVSPASKETTTENSDTQKQVSDKLLDGKIKDFTGTVISNESKLLDKSIVEKNPNLQTQVQDSSIEEVVTKQTVKPETNENIKQDAKVIKLDAELLNTKKNVNDNPEEVNVKKILDPKTQKVVETPSTKLENNISNNLSKLDKEVLVKDEQRVNVDKNTVVSPKSETTPKVDDNKSLMDKILENTNKNVKQVNQSEVASASNEIKSSKSNDVVTNIYLGAQKNSIYNQMLVTKGEGLKIIKEEGSLESVKTGANILDLGLEDASVEVEESSKGDVKTLNSNANTNSKDLGLERLILSRNARYDDSNEVKTTSTTTVTNASGMATTTTTNVNGEQTVTVNVNPALALSIQNRIIGAQQQMTTMLSDVAKQMYENYKPPVTAFRINLNPANLGSIAIMMKNEKENGISISLNMSNSATLDAFVEGQGSLRDALNRNFNNDQNSFNLDFGMQDEGGNNSQGQENSQDNKKETLASNDILETITNVTEDLEEKIEYL